MPNQIISLAIVDDHVMVREGLVSLIHLDVRFSVVIQAINGDDLVCQIDQTSVYPDICIVDINMPKKDGWKAAAELKEKWPHLKILLLSLYSYCEVADKIADSEINGFLCKTCTKDELINCLHTIHTEGYWFPPDAIKHLLKAKKDEQKKVKFNSKEMQFLKYCCEDIGYKVIADKMGVSTRTVEGYRDSLFLKLGIHTRVGLFRYAVKNGFGNILD